MIGNEAIDYQCGRQTSADSDISPHSCDKAVPFWQRLQTAYMSEIQTVMFGLWPGSLWAGPKQWDGWRAAFAGYPRLRDKNGFIAESVTVINQTSPH